MLTSTASSSSFIHESSRSPRGSRGNETTNETPLSSYFNADQSEGVNEERRSNEGIDINDGSNNSNNNNSASSSNNQRGNDAENPYASLRAIEEARQRREEKLLRSVKIIAFLTISVVIAQNLVILFVFRRTGLLMSIFLSLLIPYFGFEGARFVFIILFFCFPFNSANVSLVFYFFTISNCIIPYLSG